MLILERLYWVQWSKLELGEIKLNTDGSKNNVSTITDFAGLFRDDQGHWLGGFSRNLGGTSVLCVELYGIKHDLLKA